MISCLFLCICYLSSVLTYNSFPDRIIYQDVQEDYRYSSHKVLVRQTGNGARASRQVQVCEGANRQRGRCVRLEDCDVKNLSQDYVRNSRCVLRNQGGSGVCCPNTVPASVTYPEETSTLSPSGNRPNSAATTTPDRITSGSASSSPPDNIYPLGDFRVCGRNGKKLSGITGGATTVKDWPWMAALVYRRTLKQFCGGTVITRRHVLTAAHCFPKPDPNEVLVWLGDYDLKRQDDSKSRSFAVVQINVHEDFDVTSFENDIAILVLNDTTIYNSFIQPCCLPIPGPRYANMTAVVTGWGKLEFGGHSPNVLMEVPVPIWDQQQCVPKFAQTIFDTNLCAAAYDGGKDACQGDSGGPLVMQRKDDRWAIIGIVSWGIRCGEKDKPGIYTRVNNYLDWISQTIL